ncbi:MAG TPA: tetratricopeptide repeat protein [Thermoanaerobaculia bacterium]|nr:tetratricopeptide repeat protein [Thermoanaerobaculia bacterium]
MTALDFRQQPLQGTALYNPHLHGKDELLSLFVVRQKLLDLLLEDLRATDAGKSPQHHLILGQRGMGKTMLLRRLGFAIEDDPVLRDRWLPLTFPEEQYNIARLSDFWLNCIDSLSDLLEARGRHTEAEDLDRRAAALRSSGEEQRARRTLGLLVGASRELGRRLVLLVDNVDLVFERIREHDWTLRETLSSEPALVMIGASANAVESSFAYDQAFYDFFRAHELEGLSFEETRELLFRYAEILGTPEVKRVAEQDPGRIKVLHTLTGGNPRTVVLLFNVLAVGVEGDVRTDLERLLDQSTPLYKARFEALSTQAQQIVHAMAIRWDPISAGELAADLGWEVNTVSAQLNRLVKQGTVEKVAYDPESKAGFQIAERFFNIWYLMRASRRLRRRLIWLVEFLKVFYSQDELRARASLHINSVLNLEPAERLRYAEYSFVLAGAIADHTWSSSLEKSGLHAILEDDALRVRLAELIDLEDGDPSLKDRVVLQERFEQARSKVISTKIDLQAWSGEEFWTKLKDSLLLHLEGKVWVAENLPDLELERIEVVKSQLDSEREVLERHYACPRTVEALTRAVQSGLMTGPIDVEGAINAESVLGAAGLEATALANLLDLEPDSELLSALEQSIGATTSPFPWLVWIRRSLETREGLDSVKLDWAVKRILALAKDSEEVVSELVKILTAAGRSAEAEPAFRQSLKRNPDSGSTWLALGLLARSLGRYEEAVEALQAAANLTPRSEATWQHLNFALRGLGCFADAEQAGRRWTELNPDNAGAWLALGVALEDLKRDAEAEQAYRKVLDLQPGISSVWARLGIALSRLGQYKEAEQAERKAIELDPSNSDAWSYLGIVLEELTQFAEAEGAYRKALEIAPDRELVRIVLAWLLLLRRGDFQAAEDLARELPEEDAVAILATTLAHRGDWRSAAQYARRFISAIAEQDLEGDWHHTVAFFREAAQAGKAREAVEILEETGAAERWRPLREALEAIARGSESYLRRVAPEIRPAARQLFKELQVPFTEKQAHPKRRSSRKRKG